MTNYRHMTTSVAMFHSNCINLCFMTSIKTCLVTFFQISTSDFVTFELSETTTCSWWIIWMRSIPDLSANFTQREFSAEKSATTSVLSWHRSLRTRRCCRCSAASPWNSLTSSWTPWTAQVNDMSAITSPDDNVSQLHQPSAYFFILLPPELAN